MSATVSAIVSMKLTSTNSNNIMTNKYSDVLSARLATLRPSLLKYFDEPDPHDHSS